VKNVYITGHTAKSTPVQVTSLNDVIMLAAGHGHNLALKSDDTVWAWGRNDEGQFGNGTNTDQVNPVQISGLNNIAGIYAGGFNSFASKK
jgi:Alpha-tubulin suppressor and related RCC1 domain-containing proteins